MALTSHVSQIDKTQTPYKIDPEQTLRASQALLKHVQAEVSKIREHTEKKNLLAKDETDSEEDEENAQPIWLHITTKTFTEDKRRLKPTKIQVPHSVRGDDNLTICLITTDPQRAVKNAVADPAFPPALASRITRIIGLSKLQARHKSFEQRRQLLSEHDIFLADERIITRLPKTLGKVFYKVTAKRPIPIDLAPSSSSKSVPSKALTAKMSKDEKTAEVGNPQQIAREIEKALTCVPINLSSGHNIAIRVALHTFSPEQVQENVTAVANGVIDRLVVGGWRNVKSIHIKTSDSIAIPIWLAADLFVDDKENASIQAIDGVKEDGATASADSVKKRKRNINTKQGPQSGERKKARIAENKARDKEDTAARKARLSSQRASIFKSEL